MSQDQHLFSVRRPLGAVSHNVSAIPMPASAMKRSTSQNTYTLPTQANTTNHVRTTSGSRISDRPTQPVFHRSSSGTNIAEMAFSTLQRPSYTANFRTSTGAAAAGAGAGAGGRKSYAAGTSTPAPAKAMQSLQAEALYTQRRSSVYSARPSTTFGGIGAGQHQSFFATAPPSNGVPTDPRRLRDPTTRAQMASELMDFLAHRNFEMEMKHTLTHKTMTSPTQKDFNLMFHFLYHSIDPSYRFTGKIDQEVPALLKQLRYPFEKNISKSQLVAVGGNNWSTFLALLHWMMNLAKMMEQYSTGVYDSACEEAGFDVSADRITFHFLSDAYKEWLSIEDDDDDDAEAQRRIQPHIDAMAAKFEQANQANLEQMRRLEAESKALQEQIDELARSAPKLAKLDETIKILEEDRQKFEAYNASMFSKVEKYMNRMEAIKQGIEEKDQEMQQAEEDRETLQAKVDEQGLSVQDIDRMNTERERLQKGLEGTQARLEESKVRTSQKEAETGVKMDELESLVQQFNSLGYQVGIIPSTAHNAHGNDYELHLTPNAGPNFRASQLGASSQKMLEESDRLLLDTRNGGTGYQPHHLLAADLRTLKKNLQDLRREIGERRNAALEEDMAKVDMLDKAKEALDDKYAELETLGHRQRAAQEEFEKTKEITITQTTNSEAQIERMEKELSKMRAGLTESVQLMEQREMNVNLEYEQFTLRSASLREELHTELERMLNEIIRFKIHIQGSLEGYEEFVAQAVELEIEEQQQGVVSGGGGEGEVLNDGVGLEEEAMEE